jgi:hypothetical protein
VLGFGHSLVTSESSVKEIVFVGEYCWAMCLLYSFAFLLDHGMELQWRVLKWNIVRLVSLPFIRSVTASKGEVSSMASSIASAKPWSSAR